MAHLNDHVVSRDMFDAMKADRDHAEKCFNQATSMLEGKSREIERLKAELAEKEEYRKRLEDDYSRQGLAAREIERLAERVARNPWDAARVDELREALGLTNGE